MSTEDLERILYDMYEYDVCLPPLYGKWNSEFENKSYSIWALKELKSYIFKHIESRTYVPISTYCDIIHEFILKMARYKTINPRTKNVFNAAYSTARDVLELLEAMEDTDAEYQ